MPENPNLHTRDIRPSVPGCEALGPCPSSEDIFDLHRVVQPNDPFAAQYLRDAASRLSNRYGVAVLVWPDGVAAILAGEQSREAVINAYWQAVNRFVSSYIEADIPQGADQPRKKRRYTKRTMTADTATTGAATLTNETEN